MKIGMVFPGYSSQFVGMAKDLYDESRTIQEHFEEASSCLNNNFVKLCFASSETEMAKPEHAYVAIFLVSSSIAGLLADKNIKPDIVAGYGLGEFSAVCAAKGLSLPDGLYFLSKYAHLYNDLLKTTDVRVILVGGVAAREVEKICAATLKEKDTVASVAIYLADNSCIVSGTKAGVSHVEQVLDQMNATVKEFPVEGGLHSPLMDPVVDGLRAYLEKIDFKNLAHPLIANRDGKLVYEGPDVKDAIMQTINGPIRWDRVVEGFAEMDTIIQVGPGSSLIPMMQLVYPDKHFFAVNKPGDVQALVNFMYPDAEKTDNAEEKSG